MLNSIQYDNSIGKIEINCIVEKKMQSLMSIAFKIQLPW